SLNSNFSEARELEAQLAADKATAERRAQQRRAAAEQAAAQQAAEEEVAAEQRLRAAQEAEEEAQDEREEAGASASPSPTAPAPSPSPSPAPVETDQGPSASGLYCPVDGPVSFTDTFGAPRSGGRSHQGVDMFAARGTPVAAITDGTITRRSSSTLGGLYIYFKGSNGTEYFYTHLQGFSDAPVGGQIKGGTHIGYVGNTGNARGTPPHVHFEVAPAGSGTINPTPTARRACGK
ncbi:MAG: M23 family metallopeptidase, partial [Actinobacteria bacterium]|nr:M23 family metallopeptidase [Actinomycetota bacterium]